MFKIFLVALFLAACQPNAAATPAVQPSIPKPTAAGTKVDQANEILGVWTLTSHPHYKLAYGLLRPDGTFTFSPNPDGGKPSESGKYWFEGGQFMITDDFCPAPGKYAVMRQEQSGEPALVFTLVEDPCASRVKILTTSPEVWFGVLQ